MGLLVDKVEAKLPGKGSPKRSPKGRPDGQVIPLEPVQQDPDGEFTATDAEVEPALQAHNLARASKMSTPLEWDDRLVKYAQSHAQKLAETGKLEHSGVEDQGENLYMSDGNADLEDAVQDWLNDEKKYDGEKIGEGDFKDWDNFCQPKYRPPVLRWLV
jgi:hypothetical protein